MDYDVAFTHLARYASYMVAIENMKSRKFEDGLDPEIKKIVRVLHLPTYTEVLDRALMAEKDIEEKRKIELGKRNN